MGEFFSRSPLRWARPFPGVNPRFCGGGETGVTTAGRPLGAHGEGRASLAAQEPVNRRFASAIPRFTPSSPGGAAGVAAGPGRGDLTEAAGR